MWSAPNTHTRSGSLVVDQVEVLVDRVGRALEPERAPPHLRRHRRHVVAEQRREPPRLADVAVEAVALVLRQHDDLEVPGVGEVRQREVDEPVGAAERHRRLGPVVGEREQPLALAAGQHDDEDVGFSGHRGRTYRWPVVPRREDAPVLGDVLVRRRSPPRPVDRHDPAHEGGRADGGRRAVGPARNSADTTPTRLDAVGDEAVAVRRGRRRRARCRRARRRRSRPGSRRSASPASGPGRTARSGSASRTGRRRRTAGGRAPRRNASTKANDAGWSAASPASVRRQRRRRPMPSTTRRIGT